MLADPRTSHALRDGHVGSHQVGMAWSVQALLRSWPLAEHDMHRASALTAEVAATADRSRRLMSLALAPHQRSLTVSADDQDPGDAGLALDVTETTAGRTTFVVARQPGAPDVPQSDGVVWFSLTVADGEA